MRQARIVPEQENGKVAGIRLFGVRPDTLLGVLGMENGDRLQTINGFDMASPEKALEAYARLRTADHLTMQLNRKGQNLNCDYNIK
jgi:general secretion pathway protein C